MNTERTAIFYMANLGSEVARYLSALRENNSGAARDAWQRIKGICSDAFSLGSAGPSRTEVEALLSFIENPAQSGLPIAEVEDECEAYFMPFALKLLKT